MADPPPQLPRYLVVSGPPGSGKSTLATELADRTGRVLLSKDVVKETLMDQLPVDSVAQSSRLGRAAAQVILAVARQAPAAVLENAWPADYAVAELLALPGAPESVVELFCRVPKEVAWQRYQQRTDRHPGHFDAQRRPGELYAERQLRPLAGGWRVLVVDTGQPVDVASLLARIAELG
ncbi:AAA family ATPase [Nakamurella aerolata]|uniref:AAA family ATPase n=1 Tax=Nakamurella aerolata TaxID=1656892 RepID=A0A849A5Y6_9ACTN|nr:AAA family ATPase [Nakamurella aerolata]NNG35467.1 AAA family ATPase [Nakamurella aerolata]